MAIADRIKRRQATRRPTNVTLSEDLLAEARLLHVNVSQACEHGLRDEVARRRKDAWIEENRAAIDAWNAHVEENGLPLQEFRQF